MNQERYKVSIDANSEIYEFLSIGRNGEIAKIVQYSPIDADKQFFNLGFGDKDLTTGKIDDLSVSNNGDTQKILATVAATLVHFTERYPAVWIFTAGSTPARTRLYRMGITNHLKEISNQFEIEGLTNEGWQPFEVGVNYNAFLRGRPCGET